MTDRLALSVVVCTYNRPAGLERTLEALSLQSLASELEIIVVDDGSVVPVTVDACSSSGARLIRHPENRGLAAARNTGWAEAGGAVVAFTDDDCRPHPNWAESLLAAYKNPEVLGAGGAVVVEEPRTYLQRYYLANNPLRPLEAVLGQGCSLPYRLGLYLRSNTLPTTPEGVRDVYSLVGANFSFRRSVLLDMDGFDPGIRFGGEDEDLCYRIRQEHPTSSLIFLPDAQVDHDFEPSFGDTLRRARAYGRGNARNYAKHPAWGPTVFPLPVLWLAAAVVATRRRRLRPVAAILPTLSVPRWLIEAVRKKRVSDVGFAYLQVLQEAATNVGFFEGWRVFRDRPPEPWDRKVGAAS